MNKEEYISKIEFGIVYILFGIVLLFQYSFAFSSEEFYLFIELILAYFWTAGLFVYAKFEWNLNIFEPITIITIIYEGIYVVKPIIDLRSHSMTEHGVSVIGGGPKATFIFVMGYTIFFFSYFVKHRKLVYDGHDLFQNKNVSNFFSNKWLPWLYSAWALVYMLCIYCMFTQGLSLRYIFSFGSEGVRTVDDSNTALLFLSNFGITLVTLWLMILEYSKNKMVKILTAVLCMVYLLMRNARWLMLVFIVAPITLFYLKRKKQPQLLLLLIVSFSGLVLFAWMQANRTTLITGGAMQGWGKDGFTLEKLLAPFESDLSTYRTFYAMVERFPSQYSYVYGKTFMYTFVLFIPRILWKGKPDNPTRDLVEQSLNKEARTAGTVFSNIGEFYANYGFLGVCVFMYLLGWITTSLKHFIFHSMLKKDLPDYYYIAYSILYPLLFQWVARGNFSANFYMTFFALLPIIIISIMININNKKYQM